MKKDNIHIEELERAFNGSKLITSNDLFQFYTKFEPNIPPTTVNWRVYNLVNSGVLIRVGRGKFLIASQHRHIDSLKEYQPTLSKVAKKINKYIQQAFPLIAYCLWDSSIINEFAQHISKADFLIVECDRLACEAVFHALRHKMSSVFLHPDKKEMHLYVLEKKGSIIIRPLVTEAPIQKTNGIPTTTIEKLIVDLFVWDEFFFIHGHELINIMKNAKNGYQIRSDRMFRYAERVGAKELLEQWWLTKVEVQTKNSHWFEDENDR